jgi:nucleoside-diphosphate-sugar epimerase
MARVLIVGCGCRGRALAAALGEAGLQARGTTRDPARIAAIEAVGAEAAVADPDRLATLLPQIEGVAAICWLLGGAAGSPEAVAALHGARLRALLDRLVDAPVRGFVYEAAGSVDAALLDQGAAIVRDAHETFRLPVAVVDQAPDDHERWLSAMMSATRGLLVA